MTQLSIETLSIVAETIAEVEAAQAALMLRMWHHLDQAPDREAIFEVVGGDGRQTFVEAFLIAVRHRLGGAWPRLRGSPRLCGEHGPVLADAFGRALADVLGARSNPLLVAAWRRTMADFLAEMCGPRGPQP